MNITMNQDVKAYRMWEDNQGAYMPDRDVEAILRGNAYIEFTKELRETYFY